MAPPGWPRNAAPDREVSIELTDGKVHDAWLRAFENSTDSLPRAARFGLVSRR